MQLYLRRRYSLLYLIRNPICSNRGADSRRGVEALAREENGPALMG